jgi:hypothetical protein
MHPLTLAALLILLVNDHLLRRFWPSWITGKLGDVAWLVFAPLCVAVFTAWLAPRHHPQHEKQTLRLALVFTGGIFSLAKTIPVFHALVTDGFSSLLGFPAGTVRDPGDLLALPALAISWVIWEHSADTRNATRPGVPVLALASLLTIANMAAPDYGIDCLLPQDDGSLIALSSWSWEGSAYQSHDGGLTWETLPVGDGPSTETCPHTQPDELPWQAEDPTQPGVVYRFTPGRSIERSEDGGQSWVREITLRGAEAREAYYASTRSWDSRIGPLAAWIDPEQGAVVAAMGQEGILVRDETGAWQWVGLGPFVREELARPAVLWALLSTEVLLAAVAAVVAACTIITAGFRSSAHSIPAVAAWLVWLALILAMGALKFNLYADSLLAMAALGGLALTLLCLAIAVFLAARSGAKGWLIGAILFGLAAAVTYLVPFVLWGLGGLATYWLATLIAALLLGILTAAGVRLRRAQDR